jgi:hypothetical protein
MKNPTKKEDLSEKTPEEILDTKFERKIPKKINKKPPQKEIKKLEKIVKNEVKKAEIPIEDKIIVIERKPIDFTLQETSYFKLNYFYIKTVFIHMKNFILSPYRVYENWFNKSFNTSKLSKEDLFLKEELLNSLQNPTKELPTGFIEKSQIKILGRPEPKNPLPFHEKDTNEDLYEPKLSRAQIDYLESRAKELKIMDEKIKKDMFQIIRSDK